jgi:hypothetical protein
MLAAKQQGKKWVPYHHVRPKIIHGVPQLLQTQLADAQTKLIKVQRVTQKGEGTKDQRAQNARELRKLTTIVHKLETQMTKAKEKHELQLKDAQLAETGIPPLEGRWHPDDHFNNPLAQKKEYEYILRQIAPQPQEFPKEWDDIQDFERQAEKEEKGNAIQQAKRAVYDHSTSTVSGDGRIFYTYGDLIAQASKNGGMWRKMVVEPEYGSPAWVYNVNGGVRAQRPDMPKALAPGWRL